MTYLLYSIVLTLPVVAFCSEVSQPSKLEAKLFDAIHSKNLPQVERLVQSRVNVNAPGTNSPLQLATYLEAEDIVKELLKKKADVRGQNAEGTSALMWAVRKNNLPILKMLLAQNADEQINLQDKDGNSALLFTFSLRNPKDIMVELLNAGADIYQQNKAKDSFMSRLEKAPDLKYDKEIQAALKNYHARVKAQNDLLQSAGIHKDIAGIIGAYTSAPPVTPEKPKSKLAQWFSKK